MHTKRIIPCLDIKNGRAVKGIHFENLVDAGDPVELAQTYATHGADELVLLDISATVENRKTLTNLVKKIAAHCTIPFTVGGGIKSVADVAPLLEAGADKVVVNSAAVNNADLIDALAKEFGSQCVVLAIDTVFYDEYWLVYTHGGKEYGSRELFTWAREGEIRGAGEILFTSTDHDGTRKGFDITALKELYNSVDIPVIASGGAGTMEHFAEAFVEGKADAALAASVFHYGDIRIPDLKKYLHELNIPVRI